MGLNLKLKSLTDHKNWESCLASQSHFYVKEDGNCKPAGFLFALKEVMNMIWSHLAHTGTPGKTLLFSYFTGLV